MTPVSGSTPVARHLVWVCAGCEKCQEESTDGVTPGAPIPHDSPCTDTSPSMNGMVVVAAEDYDRLAAALADAIEGMEDMSCYVPVYFAEKWGHQGYLDRARAAHAEVGP